MELGTLTGRGGGGGGSGKDEGRGRKWTPQDQCRVRRIKQKGWSAEGFSAELGRDPMAVHQQCRKKSRSSLRCPIYTKMKYEETVMPRSIAV